jgi:hypothetical protein
MGTTSKLDVPKNITAIFLPSRAPELNPVENIWQYLRANCPASGNPGAVQFADRRPAIIPLIFAARRATNTVWFNTATGVVMLVGRLASVIPIMAIAGSLARKKKAKPSASAFPTHGLLFAMFLLFPALTLGPLAEQALLQAGRTF